LLLKINSLRNNITFEPDPIIGCIILGSPFFFDRHDWIPAPEDWHPNIVVGKNYNTQIEIGARLWSQVQNRLDKYKMFSEEGEKINLAAEDTSTYGAEYLARARLGQGSFRILVTEAYNRRCAVTGERTLPVLEAAHIKPFAKSGPNKISNGLLLRSDIHKLFDLGYITVTSNYNVEVSKRIKEEYHNGKEYYALHGSKLRILPSANIECPSPEFIEWHNQNRYMP
jgi:putative restriction endonuclease